MFPLGLLPLVYSEVMNFLSSLCIFFPFSISWSLSAGDLKPCQAVCGKVWSNCLLKNITQPSHRDLQFTLFWIRYTLRRPTCYRLHPPVQQCSKVRYWEPEWITEVYEFMTYRDLKKSRRLQNGVNRPLGEGGMSLD